MERSPLSTLAGLGVAGVLLAVVLWLAALRQVSDPQAAAAARAVDDTLGPNLMEGYATRVTMVRDGTGIDAPRRYVARYRPAARLAEDAAGLRRMAERVAEIVSEQVGSAPAEVLVHCVAETGDAGDSQSCFRRTGAPGAWALTPVEPVPPLPALSSRLERGSGRRAGRRSDEAEEAEDEAGEEGT